MTADAGLLLFLIAFWGLFAAAVKMGNWRAGKRWSDGPSLVPLILFVPMLAWVASWLINLVAAPWGSWGVAGLHMGWLAVSLVLVWLYPAPDTNQEAEPVGERERLHSRPFNH